MKELYLGLVVVAFILIILSITVESSLTGFNIAARNNNLNNTQNTPVNTISSSELKNSFPDRAYNKDNLNRVFLQKYYNNKYCNNFNAKNKFYMPN